jgi:hypothetical protein
VFPAEYTLQPCGISVTKVPKRQRHLNSTPSPLPTSLQEYLKTLIPARWRLLADLHMPSIEHLRSAIGDLAHPNSILESGSDGGLAGGIATMGFVITNGKEVL